VVDKQIIIILELCSESREKQLRPKSSLDAYRGILLVLLVKVRQRRPIQFVGAASRA
jgi:hypothetical protein